MKIKYKAAIDGWESHRHRGGKEGGGGRERLEQKRMNQEMVGPVLREGSAEKTLKETV